MASDPFTPDQIAEDLRLDKLYRHHKAGGKRLNWPGADLSGADLTRVDLTRVDLSGADLSGADLIDANLSGANLTRADLRSADLRSANLRGADLRSADLTRADLDFASWPLHCGGTHAKTDARGSLQLIYHAFNQDHQDPEIRAALEAIRPLAERFRAEYRSDATPLRVD